MAISTRESFESVRERPVRLAPIEETTDDLMWLFGLFVGDGSIEREPAQNGGSRWAHVTFSVPRDDRARPRLVDVMNRVMPGTQPGERHDGVTLRWSSVELADLFELNGFLRVHHAKRLPAWVLDLPESQRLSLVAGYLDSDGCAPKGRRAFNIKSANRPLLEDVADVLTSLGIASRVHTEYEEDRPVQILGYTTTSRGSHRIEFRIRRTPSRPGQRTVATGGAEKPPRRPPSGSGASADHRSSCRQRSRFAKSRWESTSARCRHGTSRSRERATSCPRDSSFTTVASR